MNSENLPSKDQDNKTKMPSKAPSWGFFNYFSIILLIVLFYFFFNSSDKSKETNWGEFERLVKKHRVEKIIIKNKEVADIYLKDTTDGKKKKMVETPSYYFNIGTPEIFEKKLDKIQSSIPEEKKISVEYEEEKNVLPSLLLWILPLLFLFFIFRKMASGLSSSGSNPLFSFGQSGAKLFEKDKKVQVTFDNVAGLDEVKQEMEETVDFLTNPEAYTNLGAKIPKGILLIGPPGTGKTLIARAVAGEAKVSFFSLSGSEFVEMFVGVGASRVRDLFKKAKAKSPSIVFIDEIDAIGRSRGNIQAMGTNDERENTLNQLLTEMDGFTTNSGVIVLAATNRGDVLDNALLRPGRFDRLIYLELPDKRERKEIFEVHMKPLVMDDTVDVEMLASQTPGFSGADIANACNEAALIAARRKKKRIDMHDFSDALDRIIGGLEKRKRIISTKERKIVAFHEAGHALATCYLKGFKDIVKISIIPRGKSLGAAWYKPEELQLVSTSHLLNELSILLAGRAAEEVIFGEVTSGALDDLEKSTKQAYTMIAYYGLGEKLGHLSYFDSSGNREAAFQKPYSEETARLIDEEVRRMISDSYNKVKSLFIEHKDELKQIGELLLKKEVIYKEDLKSIVKVSDKD